jgi:hypothetical protein
VFRRFCTNSSRNSAVQNHIRDHVEPYVTMNLIMSDDVPSPFNSPAGTLDDGPAAVVAAMRARGDIKTNAAIVDGIVALPTGTNGIATECGSTVTESPGSIWRERLSVSFSRGEFVWRFVQALRRRPQSEFTGDGAIVRVMEDRH